MENKTLISPDQLAKLQGGESEVPVFDADGQLRGYLISPEQRRELYSAAASLVNGNVTADVRRSKVGYTTAEAVERMERVYRDGRGAA
jgi:hypothetical protein